MTKERYIALMDFWKARPKLLSTAGVIQKFLELAVYIIYPLFILYLLIKGDRFWIYSLLDCGVFFVAISVLRKFLNKPRPYEEYGVLPAVAKDTKGCSFPSRHAFSAAIIAVNLLAVIPWAGIIILCFAVIISALRVLLGLHFVRDTVCGLILGILLGLPVFLA